MQVGDLVRETSKMDRKCSMGLVLKTQPCRAANCECDAEEYLVHFFDDDDECWMSSGFLDVISKKSENK